MIKYKPLFTLNQLVVFKRPDSETLEQGFITAAYLPVGKDTWRYDINKLYTDILEDNIESL